ncbi:hypothetical protein [Nannocystis pusilla]|uniref:hypothetical protein n=1 Tax=Nannocystis pusilla TaxID=889268 RepID=UPI003DA48A96
MAIAAMFFASAEAADDDPELDDLRDRSQGTARFDLTARDRSLARSRSRRVRAGCAEPWGMPRAGTNGHVPEDIDLRSPLAGRHTRAHLCAGAEARHPGDIPGPRSRAAVRDRLPAACTLRPHP